MAWVTPTVFVHGDALTAAQLNVLSDDLLETAAAKATVASWPRHFVSTGSHALAERLIRDHNIDGTSTTNSVPWSDLPDQVGPQITLVTGPFALVFSNCELGNDTANAVSRTSFEVSGMTSSLSTDHRGVKNEASTAGNRMRAGAIQLIALTSGDNVFTMTYRVGSGVGTFLSRRMTVMAL